MCLGLYFSFVSNTGLIPDFAGHLPLPAQVNLRLKNGKAYRRSGGKAREPGARTQPGLFCSLLSVSTQRSNIG